MSDLRLEHLGKLIVRDVRDSTIEDWKMIVSGTLKGERADSIRQVLSALELADDQWIDSLLPKVIDSVLHNLLVAIEHDDQIDFSFRHGIDDLMGLKNLSDGLAGEMYSEEGWIVKYSNYR